MTKKIDEIMDRVLQEGPSYNVADDYESAEDAFQQGNLFIYMNIVLNERYGKLSVGKWEAEEEPQMGTWAWWNQKNEDFVVYITPFFETKKGIDWQAIEDVTSSNMEVMGEGVVNFKPTGNPDKDFKSYMNIVKKILNKY